MAPFKRCTNPDVIAVVDPVLIDRIFRSGSFHVIDYSAHYRRLSERTGLDLSGILTALDHIPLAHEGERHRALRGEMAQLFRALPSEDEERPGPSIDGIIDEALRSASEIDIVAQIAAPVFDLIFLRLLQADRRSLGLKDGGSQVFDGLMSLNRRKRLELILRDSLERLAAVGGELRAVPELALALNILGQDALIGSLSLSLWHDLGAHEGLRLADVRFSPVPPATSVAYIDRAAAEDTVIGPLSVVKGDVVRLYLDATTIEARAEDGGVLFGKGRHSCLGKPIALTAWRLIGKSLNTSSRTFRRGEFAIRRNDHVFSYPTRAVLHLGR